MSDMPLWDASCLLKHSTKKHLSLFQIRFVLHLPDDTPGWMFSVCPVWDLRAGQTVPIMTVKQLGPTPSTIHKEWEKIVPSVLILP
jgi:hypothetical protein